MDIHHDKTTIWLQITAGQGPKECAWVVAQASRKLCQEAEEAGLLVECVESLAFDKLLRKQQVIETDAYLSVLIRLQGRGAKAFASTWEGTVKWQGESPYRPKHRRLNWFVGIALMFMPKNEPLCFLRLEEQIKVEALRSKGPGGQHVNKTCSAVRITHIPTGLQVRAESDRSQHRNRAIAIERLKIMLISIDNQKEKSLDQVRWLHHYQVKRGNPRRTFYGLEFAEKANDRA